MATRKTATKTAGKKSRTVMVYLAGDNNLDSAGVVDLGEMKQVGSNDQINIVAQFDRSTGKRETKRYYLRKGTALAKDALGSLRCHRRRCRQARGYSSEGRGRLADALRQRGRASRCRPTTPRTTSTCCISAGRCLNRMTKEVR